jgi:predicted nucleic acid-binding protein
VSFLVDTNVISELVRKTPNAHVLRWAENLDEFTLSVVTVEEVFFGLSAKTNARIHRWFEAFLETHCRVLDVTAPIARQAGVLRGQLAARGRVRSQADMLIAATAAQGGLTIATRDEKDFEGCGVAVTNPFRPDSG